MYLKENQTLSVIELLRPENWLDTEYVQIRHVTDDRILTEAELAQMESAEEFEGNPEDDIEVWIELPEMGVLGWATLVAIDEEVTIKDGPGNVVTGTFAHVSDNVMDLQLEGQTKPIGCTSNHPFWSVDRQDFVEAGQLMEGEQVRLYNGETKRVIQKLPRPGPEIVYNLEVYAEHVYHVTQDGVLVHNSCKNYFKSNGRVRRFNGPKPSYIENTAHISYLASYNKRKTPLPSDAKRVFAKAIPDNPDTPKVWVGRNAQGLLYRFSLDHDKMNAHFSGMADISKGRRNTNWDIGWKYIRDRFKEMDGK